MSKYDFGYELEEGSTNQWAFNLIKPHTHVLEMGASVGNLTKHLHEEKLCSVDIIEIDKEAGEKASDFAEVSLIGPDEGDLEKEFWYKKLAPKKYQYIVILDVLEHLNDPKHVLELAYSLLEEDGRILLSVPNIAHNSIIVNLWNNKFEYTEYGLLDKTHIHFFTFRSLIEMLNSVNLNIESEDAVYKDLGESEIQNGYQDIPEGVEYFLKTREYAEAYQYLFVACKREKKIKNKLETTRPSGSLYTSIVLINGLSENRVEVLSDLRQIDLEIDLTQYHMPQSIRFVPVEKPCIVKSLKIIGSKNQTQKRLYYNWCTGLPVNKEAVLLTEERQEINIELDDCYQTIKISCCCSLFNIDVKEQFLPLFSELKYILNSIQQDYQNAKLEVEQTKYKWKEIQYDLAQVQHILSDRELDLENINLALERKKQELEVCNCKNQELEDSLKRYHSYTSMVLFDGLLEKQFALTNNGQIINAEIDMDQFRNSQSLRLVPSDKNCIITNLKVYGFTDTTVVQLHYNWTTGIGIDEENVLLLDEHREINFALETEYKRLEINCCCFLIYGNFVKNLQSSFLEWTYSKEKMIEEVKTLKADNNLLVQEMKDMQTENRNLLERVNNFESTWLYRLFKKGKSVIWKK